LMQSKKHSDPKRKQLKRKNNSFFRNNRPIKV
jgi:hypothetical protein